MRPSPTLKIALMPSTNDPSQAMRPLSRAIFIVKTLINAANYTDKVLLWKTAIHITVLLSAVGLAYTDRLMAPTNMSNH